MILRLTYGAHDVSRICWRAAVSVRGCAASIAEHQLKWFAYVVSQRLSGQHPRILLSGQSLARAAAFVICARRSYCARKCLTRKC